MVRFDSYKILLKPISEKLTMPHCTSCSAPLPAYSSLCDYCGAKNDVDLQGIAEFTVTNTLSERNCPICGRAMETIGLSTIADFYIERCPDCLGLFFDPEELNALLDKSVANVYRFNLQKIFAMNQMVPDGTSRSRTYIRCPICGELMNRINFGTKSGVVIDQCTHGVWLDSGELRKLLEWRKAGGQLYHEKIMNDRAERERREEENRRAVRISGEHAWHTSSYRERETGAIALTPLLESAVKLIWRIFT